MSSHHSRDTLTAEGETAQALSTYKSLLLTKPNDVDAQLALAAIYRKLGQMNRAALAYELAAQTLAAQGKVKAGLGVVQLLVDMSPDNTDRRILLAEQYAKAELLADAVRELGVAADSLHRANRLDEYARVLDRLRRLESKSREAGMPPPGQEALSSATTAVLAQRPQGEPGAAERLSESPPGATTARTAAELPPVHTSAIIAEADSFLRLGLLDKAVAHLTAALVGNPSLHELREPLAKLYVAQRDYKQAVAELWTILNHGADRQEEIRLLNYILRLDGHDLAARQRLCSLTANHQVDAPDGESREVAAQLSVTAVDLALRNALDTHRPPTDLLVTSEMHLDDTPGSKSPAMSHPGVAKENVRTTYEVDLADVEEMRYLQPAAAPTHRSPPPPPPPHSPPPMRDPGAKD